MKESKISIRNLNLFYSEKQALSDISIDIYTKRITAIIGPSGCGKSTFLRVINRMNDTIPGCRTSGALLVDGEDVYAPTVDPVLLRRKVGLIFQKPNPFPKSVHRNVAFGDRV